MYLYHAINAYQCVAKRITYHKSLVKGAFFGKKNVIIHFIMCSRKLKETQAINSEKKLEVCKIEDFSLRIPN